MSIIDDFGMRADARAFDEALARMIEKLGPTAAREQDPSIDAVTAALETLDIEDQRLLWFTHVEPVGATGDPAAQENRALRRRVRKAERALAQALAAVYAAESTDGGPACGVARRALGPYVRHRLGGARRRVVEEHLVCCERCLRAFIDVRQAGSTLRAVAPALIAGATGISAGGELLGGATATGSLLTSAPRQGLNRCVQWAQQSPAQAAVAAAGAAAAITVTVILVAGFSAETPPAVYPMPEAAPLAPAAPSPSPDPDPEAEPDEAVVADSREEAEGGDPAPAPPPPLPAAPPPYVPPASEGAPPAQDPAPTPDQVPPAQVPVPAPDEDEPGGDEPMPGPGEEPVVAPDAYFVTVQIPPSEPAGFWAIEVHPVGVVGAEGDGTLPGMLQAGSSEPVGVPEGVQVEQSDGEHAPARTWLVRNTTGSGQIITFRLLSPVSLSVRIAVVHVPV